MHKCIMYKRSIKCHQICKGFQTDPPCRPSRWKTPTQGGPGGRGRGGRGHTSERRLQEVRQLRVAEWDVGRLLAQGVDDVPQAGEALVDVLRLLQPRAGGGQAAACTGTGRGTLRLPTP